MRMSIRYLRPVHGMQGVSQSQNVSALANDMDETTARAGRRIVRLNAIDDEMVQQNDTDGSKTTVIENIQQTIQQQLDCPAT